jgi:hypothetical protein
MVAPLHWRIFHYFSLLATRDYSAAFGATFEVSFVAEKMLAD